MLTVPVLTRRSLSIPARRRGERFAARSMRASPERVATARSWTRCTLAHWGLPEERTETAEQVVSELAANATVHTGSPRMTLGLVLLPGSLTLRVTTDAPPTERPLRARRAGEEDEHGRGLALVHALTSSWGSTPAPRRRTMVWARWDWPLRWRVTVTSPGLDPEHPFREEIRDHPSAPMLAAEVAAQMHTMLDRPDVLGPCTVRVWPQDTAPGPVHAAPPGQPPAAECQIVPADIPAATGRNPEPPPQ